MRNECGSELVSGPILTVFFCHSNKPSGKEIQILGMSLQGIS